LVADDPAVTLLVVGDGQGEVVGRGRPAVGQGEGGDAVDQLKLPVEGSYSSCTRRCSRRRVICMEV